MSQQEPSSLTLVHIFGASGSGTSTLGRMLSEKTGACFLDTDDFLWEATDPPFTEKREKPERLRLLRAALDTHEFVVLSGSLVGWGDALIPRFTLAVRMETPTPIRMDRLQKRERERFGERIDRGGDMYEIHRSFLEWASAYDDAGPEQRSRAQHDRWQTLLRCPILAVDGSLPPEENCSFILARIGSVKRSAEL